MSQALLESSYSGLQAPGHRNFYEDFLFSGFTRKENGIGHYSKTARSISLILREYLKLRYIYLLTAQNFLLGFLYRETEFTIFLFSLTWRLHCRTLLVMTPAAAVILQS